MLFFNLIVPDKYKVVILKSKILNLGTLKVNETTIIEWKPLFSLKTFYFHKGKAQEIFHTHSFNAISFLIYGNYTEAFYDLATNSYSSLPRNRSRLIYIPKNRFHQITESIGCRTIMLTSSWDDFYREYDGTFLFTNGIHRKVVSKIRIN